MQECIATLRDNKAKLEELRSTLASLGKQALLDRKEQIKKLAREHRDANSLTDAELDESLKEIELLNQQIEEKERGFSILAILKHRKYYTEYFITFFYF